MSPYSICSPRFLRNKLVGPYVLDKFGMRFVFENFFQNCRGRRPRRPVKKINEKREAKRLPYRQRIFNIVGEGLAPPAIKKEKPQQFAVALFVISLLADSTRTAAGRNGRIVYISQSNAGSRHIQNFVFICGASNGSRISNNVPVSAGGNTNLC